MLKHGRTRTSFPCRIAGAVIPAGSSHPHLVVRKFGPSITPADEAAIE